MRDQRYVHAEAFCLMTYKCEGCAKKETLWNSRDGVTPFIIGCSDEGCRGQMLHVDFKLDACKPDFVPPKGMRIFVDMTRAEFEARWRRHIDRHWDDQRYPMSAQYASKEEAFAVFAANGPDRGAPCVEVVR